MFKLKKFIDLVLKIKPDISIKYNVNLQKFNTFKINVYSSILFEIKDILELQLIFILLNKFSIKYFIVGNGSNILFNDNYLYDVIISMKKFMNQIIINNNNLIIQAGCTITNICKKAYKYSLSGIEFAYGIPGTIGGAIYMNAGAFGSEIKDIILQIKYLDSEGNFHITNSKTFGYRYSYFTKNKNLIIVETILKLNYEKKEKIENLMKKNLEIRKDKHPMNLPNMGSIFKKPDINIFVGKLIEECGLKGLAIGDAQISEKHCGFIINKGKAKTCDVLNLINYIKYKVYKKFNIKLECEIDIF